MVDTYGIFHYVQEQGDQGAGAPRAKGFTTWGLSIQIGTPRQRGRKSWMRFTNAWLAGRVCSSDLADCNQLHRHDVGCCSRACAQQALIGRVLAPPPPRKIQGLAGFRHGPAGSSTVPCQNGPSSRWACASSLPAPLFRAFSLHRDGPRETLRFAPLPDRKSVV